MSKETKRCPKCGQTKPVSDFSRNSCKRDGLDSRCKACYAAYYQENRDRILSRRRAWNKDHKTYSRDRAKRYYLENRSQFAATDRNRQAVHPEQIKAMIEVRKARLSGELVSGPCEGCGDDRNGPVEAHHDDYSKPLEVRWLCRSCHKRLHADMRREQQ